MEDDNVKTTQEKSFARHVPTVARALLGLLFFASGLANLCHLAPEPSLPEGADFAGAMTRTGYMMPLIFGTQFIVGTLLLANRFVPLALAWAYRKAYGAMLALKTAPGAA
jgi:hypothetical protein